MIDNEIKAPETLSRWDGVQPDMVEMFEEADAHGVWFQYLDRELWFSPHELAAHQRAGSMRGGKALFRLRDPLCRLKELQNNVARAQLDLKEFVARMTT